MSDEMSCLCGNRDFILTSRTPRFDLIRCNNCGQVRIDNKNLSGAQYDDSQYFDARNSYLERWNEFADHFQKLIAKIKKFKAGGKLLDVGSGVGILLDVAKRHGFDTLGVEVSRWASQVAREKGLDVVIGTLEESHLPSNQFDVIILNHVLEHIPQPSSLLREIKRILKTDGILVVGVPNYGSMMSKIKKLDWMSLLPEEHIWQFTHKTLDNLLGRSGFVEMYFEAKDNHAVNRRQLSGALVCLINMFAMILNQSEAMLLFYKKTDD